MIEIGVHTIDIFFQENVEIIHLHCDGESKAS